MEIENIYKSQIEELTKLSFNFYSALAKGAEPLTYTTIPDASETECQVEVMAEMEGDSILISFGFDTNFGARFNQSKGYLASYKLSKDHSWVATD